MVQLYEYQTKYLASLPARSIMAADTGTGKTFMALAHYEKYANGQPLLILAPASKVRTRDWERDIEEYFEGRIPPYFEVYSYEKFSRNPTNVAFRNGKRAIWHQHSPHYKGKQFAVIADEVHKAKNPQSGVGTALYWAAKDADFFVGLSATPLPNGWIDFANYMKIFGFVRNITEFKKRYCNYVTYKGFPELKNYWHENEMVTRWTSISRLLTKAQAKELPPRTFTGVDFKRPAAYVKTLLDRVTEDGRVLDNPSALAHALRQTLTGEKMAYLSDLLEGTSENVVIFYNYITEREAILDMISKKHKAKRVIRQDGDHHELPEKKDWATVENSVTLAHYKSGSTGVEMTYATQVIYFSPTYSYAEYIQSIGRVYRHGQTNKTTFFNFRTPNSIEKQIYDCLMNKSDFQAAQWEVK